MLVLPRRVEHAFDVTIQCPHDTDAGEHRPAIFRDQQQRLHGGLPFGGVVFCLWQFSDVSVASRKVISFLPLGNTIGSKNV
jgi:hypothetical protein